MSNLPNQPEKPKRVPNERPRRSNPIFRFISTRITLVLVIAVLIFAGSAACAIFAPLTFQNMVKAAQSAGLKTYTIILGITGNPALKLTTYEADVTAQASISRDMGMLGILYGEGANIVGTVRVALGADLKNNLFGVLSCDIDARTVRTTENRAPLAGTAFDNQQIKQEAYKAFEHQAAQQAIATYWSEARKRLQNQVTSWALGVVVPEVPTLPECPSNLVEPQATPTR